MFYILVVIAVFFGFLYEKSKAVTTFQVSLIWILLGWSYGNADYQNYLTRYINYDSSALGERTEWLFFQAFKLGNLLHLTYDEFLPILALIYVILLVFVVKKFSPNPNFVLSLYLIFPACIEATQIRFAFAGVIVLIGFIFLFNDKCRLGEIYFAISVIIAALIHIGTLLFMVMLPIRKLNRKKTYVYTSVLCIGIAIAGLGGISAILSLFPGMLEKLSFATKYSMDTIRYWIFLELFIWIFFMFMIKIFERFCRFENIKANRNINYIVKVGIISAVTIPVTLLFQDAYRLQQCLSILYFCAISSVFPQGVLKNIGRKKILFNKTRIALITGAIVFAAFYLYAIVLSSSNFETVFVPYFEENIFFQ